MRPGGRVVAARAHAPLLDSCNSILSSSVVRHTNVLQHTSVWTRTYKTMNVALVGPPAGPARSDVPAHGPVDALAVVETAVRDKLSIRDRLCACCVSRAWHAAFGAPSCWTSVDLSAGPACDALLRVCAKKAAGQMHSLRLRSLCSCHLNGRSGACFCTVPRTAVSFAAPLEVAAQNSASLSHVWFAGCAEWNPVRGVACLCTRCATCVTIEFGCSSAYEPSRQPGRGSINSRASAGESARWHFLA